MTCIAHGAAYPCATCCAQVELSAREERQELGRMAPWDAALVLLTAIAVLALLAPLAV